MVIDASESEIERILQERLKRVRTAIDEAARKANRKPEEITLIGVSKQFPPKIALAAYRAGLKDLGENRVQDLLEKKRYLDDAGGCVNWHLIGTLQRNKVRQIIGQVCLIHSVDSLPLLSEISKRSVLSGVTTDVLMQVNSSGENSKHGFQPDEVISAFEAGQNLPQVRICGLMTMAQQTENPDETLPVFSLTRSIFETIREQFGTPPHFAVLSMGMSQDFVQAISCGATHVRIGTALFGPRPKRDFASF